MYNKSREKLVPKPPTPLKQTATINRPPPRPASTTTAVLPAIKPPKESTNKPSSLTKPTPIRPTLSSKGSTKKIETSSSIPSSKKGKAEQVGWGQLPLNLLLQVSQFSSSSAFQVYGLSLVCSTWRQLMSCANAVYFWRRFKRTEKASTFREFKECMQAELRAVKEKRSGEFEAMFARLFNYGSTKENLANKLIGRLKLELTVTINKRTYPQFPFRLRTFNFSSYLYAKIPELSQLPFDLYTPHNLFKDDLHIALRFYSRTFKVAHELTYRLTPEEVADCAVRQRAFNYFLEKNLIITFFEGDANFLYAFLEVSVLELVVAFRRAIRGAHQAHLDRRTRALPLHKQLCETEFEDFVQYLKFQADFELHLSYHNSLKQIFTHCDTKVYPLEYDAQRAYFQVRIEDTFPKTATFLLDNKMGMAEPVDDLFLLDFVLKDRDRFLIVFSGFIFAREATQQERETIEDYFQFAELPVKLLQFRGEKYDFSIMIIEEAKKNFIHHARFHLYP